MPEHVQRDPAAVGRGLQGLLAFPLTPFTPDGSVNVPVLREHVEQLIGFGVTGLFPACGTGEFPALSLAEQVTVVRATIEQVAGRVLVLTATAIRGSIDDGRTAALAATGVDGFLVFPPRGDGIDDRHAQVDYFREAAGGTGRAVIPYQRDGFVLADGFVEEAARVPEIIGIKDGDGDLAVVRRLREEAPPGFRLINGTPTAELLEVDPASHGLFDAYSSALLNCMPEVAVAFARARSQDDRAEMRRLIDDFVAPFVTVRNRQDGYAVSLVKAAARIRGLPAGPARPPLPEPTADDLRDVAEIIDRAARDLAGSPTGV